MKKMDAAQCFMTLGFFASSLFVAVSAQSVTSANASSSPLYFANVDKNHDGLISRSEVPKELHDLRVHFDQYDVNKDHRLSVAEYSSYLTKLAAGSGGSCNNSQQTVRDPNCSAVGSERDSQPNSRLSAPPPQPPPPPPTGGH